MMAGSKLPSGSLRAHGSNATKSRSQTFPKVEPKIKKGTFTGDDSDDSSDSSSGSDSGAELSNLKKESALDFNKRVSTPSSKTKTKGAKIKDGSDVSKTATPAKSPTVNGLVASMAKKGEGAVSVKKVKKEDSSSASESDSDSESSSDNKTKKAPGQAKQIKKEETSSASESDSESDSSTDKNTNKASTRGKQIKKSKSSSTTSSESESSSDSESDSESDKANNSNAKSPAKSFSKAESPVKATAKPATKAKSSPVRKEASSESETSSTGSESEGEDSDSDSEDPSQQIEEQIRNDLKSAKPQSSGAQAPEPGKKKAKHAKSVSEDEDGDVEMMDQSMALTNGGNPTNVGDVPEFVAPDFHLRKLEGDSSAADVAKFFSKAQLEGKQVWYITAPASLPVTVVQDLSIPVDQAEQGRPVLSHNGEDYRMVFDDPAASSTFRLLIPNNKGNEYSLLERPVKQTMHFTRSETFPPEGPSSVVTTQTVSTTRPARPQPEGLRARYTPLGVPAPKPTIAPPNKAVASLAGPAAKDMTSTPSKSSSKKKRKHTDDGEVGSVATAITTTPAPNQKKDPHPSNKNPQAEKSAKRQKTTRDGTPNKRETPVPLPMPQITAGGSGSGYSGQKTTSFTSASQPLPRGRMSASPGATLPATQVPVKFTPVPPPSLPVSISYSGSDGGPRASLTSQKSVDTKQEAKRAERDRKKADKEAEKAAKAMDKERKKAEKKATWAEKSSNGGKLSSSHIPVPRFENGRPVF